MSQAHGKNRHLERADLFGMGKELCSFSRCIILSFLDGAKEAEQMTICIKSFFPHHYVCILHDNMFDVLI